jgi:hypothetical protein
MFGHNTAYKQGTSEIGRKSELNTFYYSYYWGHTMAQLVEALRYKPEGCGFDSPWCHWIFSLT